MKTRMQAHVCYRVLYHIVWIAKYRHKLLKGGVGKYCEKIIKTIVVKEYPDIFIDELKVVEDHVHMAIVIPPKYAISKVMSKIKGSSSRMMRRQFEYLRKERESLWSIGCFVSTVGLDEKILKKYILHQEKEDKGQLML